MLLSDLLIGSLVSLINFGIHAVMTALIVVAARGTHARTHHRSLFLRLAALLIFTTTALLSAHVAEIAAGGCQIRSTSDCRRPA
jgi:hypothetical protein